MKVQQNELIGPIFNKMLISETVWEQHFEILTDFWEAVLFRGKNYKGHAVEQHVWVDSQTGRNLRDEHFKNWLNIWHETLDEHFEGEKVEIAKSSAISIARTFHSKIMEVRNYYDPSVDSSKKLVYVR